MTLGQALRFGHGPYDRPGLRRGRSSRHRPTPTSSAATVERLKRSVALLEQVEIALREKVREARTEGASLAAHHPGDRRQPASRTATLVLCSRQAVALRQKKGRSQPGPNRMTAALLAWSISGPHTSTRAHVDQEVPNAFGKTPAWGKEKRTRRAVDTGNPCRNPVSFVAQH